MAAHAAHAETEAVGHPTLENGEAAERVHFVRNMGNELDVVQNGQRVAQDIAPVPVIPQLRGPRPQLLLQGEKGRPDTLVLRLSFREQPEDLAVAVNRLVEAAMVSLHDVVDERLDSFVSLPEVPEGLRRVQRAQDLDDVRQRVEPPLLLELLRQVVQLPLHLAPVHCAPHLGPSRVAVRGGGGSAGGGAGLTRMLPTPLPTEPGPIASSNGSLSAAGNKSEPRVHISRAGLSDPKKKRNARERRGPIECAGARSEIERAWRSWAERVSSSSPPS
mmetsp:Transcript_15339/g.38949  ORF Transcript_15339/g.38949 Transcript_15339/m.38949 type:complete len:275 (+) Transcript_15339:1350-2174(+)